MPHEVVATLQLTVACCRLGDLVAQGVVELVPRGLNVHPLLAVGRRHLSEFRPVVRNRRVLLVVEHHIIDSSTEVIETRLFSKDIKTRVLERLGLGPRPRRSRRGSGQSRNEKSELHDSLRYSIDRSEADEQGKLKIQQHSGVHRIHIYVFAPTELPLPRPRNTGPATRRHAF